MKSNVQILKFISMLITPLKSVDGRFGVLLPASYSLLVSPSDTTQLKDILNKLGLMTGRSKYDAQEIMRNLPQFSRATSDVWLEIEASKFKEVFKTYYEEVLRDVLKSDGTLAYQQWAHEKREF